MDGLDAHVVVHPLLHKSRFSEALAFLRHGHGVELVELRQVEEDIGLVVTQAAYRVLTVVWVEETAAGEIGQAVEVEHLLEVTDPVSGQVELFEGDQPIQADTNVFDVVLS